MGTLRSIKFEAVVEEATKQGKWVILNKLDEAFFISQEIKRSLSLLAHAHRNFRLWITTEIPEFLPNQLFEQAHRFYVSRPKSVRETFLDLLSLPVFSSPGIYDEAPEKAKRLMTSVLFMHALLIQRRKYQTDTSKVFYKYRNNELESSIREIAKQANQSKEISI